MGGGEDAGEIVDARLVRRLQLAEVAPVGVQRDQVDLRRDAAQQAREAAARRRRSR